MTLPTHPAWVQVWDGNSSNKLGHPLSPGWGSREGAGERAEKAAANFPLPCCLHPSDELAPGFTASSPGQVCQDRRLASAWFQFLVLQGVDTRGESSGCGRGCAAVPMQGRQAEPSSPGPMGRRQVEVGLVGFHPASMGQSGLLLGRKNPGWTLEGHCTQNGGCGQEGEPASGENEMGEAARWPLC